MRAYPLKEEEQKFHKLRAKAPPVNPTTQWILVEWTKSAQEAANNEQIDKC